MGVVNTEKKLTGKIPFYSIMRDDWGWVRMCVKPDTRKCGKCMFSKKCKVEGE